MDHSQKGSNNNKIDADIDLVNRKSIVKKTYLHIKAISKSVYYEFTFDHLKLDLRSNPSALTLNDSKCFGFLE